MLRCSTLAGRRQSFMHHVGFSQDFRRNYSDFAAAAPSGERAKAAKIQAKNRTNPLKAKNEKTPTDSGRGSTSKRITTNQNYECLHA